MSGNATLPRKRLFGTIRDLLCSGEDSLSTAAVPSEPPRQRVRPCPTSGAPAAALSRPLPQSNGPTAPGRRMTIADLLVAPPWCAACLEHVRGAAHAYTCLACFGSFCEACLASYAAIALADVALLPLRCASTGCRAPIPLSSVAPLLSAQDATALADAQQRVLRPPEPNTFTISVPRCVAAAIADNNRVSELVQDEHNTLSVGSDVDAQLEELMEREGWQCCPRCGNGVERTQGCRHIVCICGGEFCYQCGDVWSPGMLGCPRQCGLGLTAAVVPAVDDGILLPGEDVGEQAVNRSHRQGNIATHLFEHMRDQVWRRLLELLEDLRVQQLGNHLQRGDGWNRRDTGQVSVEGGDIVANVLNGGVDMDPELVAVGDSSGHHSELRRDSRLVPAPPHVPLLHADFGIRRPSSPRRVAVYDLVHSDNPVTEMHNAIHAQYASTHRSMKLSSLVLHNLDYLLHDDEAMD
jgi:hypothetical protein